MIHRVSSTIIRLDGGHLELFCDIGIHNIFCKGGLGSSGSPTGIKSGGNTLHWCRTIQEYDGQGEGGIH